jgi:predicted secreted protein
MTRVIVTEQNSNAEFRLHMGDELIVRLDAIPGTGYAWIVLGEVEGVLSQIGEPVFEKSGERAMGAVEQQVFTFHIKSTGVHRLELEYRRPWEKPGTATKSFSITVIAEE